jgi:hypothetical protein
MGWSRLQNRDPTELRMRMLSFWMAHATKIALIKWGDQAGASLNLNPIIS